MVKGVLQSLLVLVAGAGLASGQAPATAEPVPAPQPPAAGSAAAAAPGKTAAPAEALGLDTHPWNPPIGHANVWPHPAPIQVAPPDPAPPGDFWFVPKFLLWGIKGFHVPPLATTGTPGGRGVLGRPGTAVLGEGSEFEHDAFAGGRFTVGTWLDDEHSCGFQAGYFFLGEHLEQTDFISPGGPGSPVLARPFFNVRTKQQDAFLVASPAQGPADIHTAFRSALQGAPADLVYDVYSCPRYRVELQGGFRYENLLEDLYVAAAGTFPPGFPRHVGQALVVSDEFHAQNILFGGDLGVRGEYHWGCWVGTVLGDLVLGANQETVHVVGGTTEGRRRRQKRPAVATGGLLALPSNMDSYHSGQFSAIPELDLQIGYQLNPYVRAFVGYSFLYWSNVVRPGDQIDGGINAKEVPALHRGPGPIPGPARPEFSFHETDFWAQGLTVGAEIRY